jgi:phytanoyl-CoA hydroxylase
MEAKDISQLKASFRKDGYLFFPRFLRQEEVEDLNKKLATFIQEVVPTVPPEHAFYEDKNDPASLKQLFHLNAYDPYFQQMLVGSRFEELAGMLLEDEVVAKNLEYFNKPPKIGKPTPPHQDNYYFMLKPAEAVTMWLALEEVDSENGCVRYVRGSHLQGMRPHGRTQTLGFSQGMTDFGQAEDLANEVAFPAQPGDLLVHHSMTIHRADGNSSSSRTRRALGFIYFAASAKEDTEAKEAYQKELAKEIREKYIADKN